MDKHRILIADDQPDVLEALRFLLKGEGYQTDAVSSPTAILNSLQTRDYDALIMDLNYTRDTTSGQEGLDLLTKIQGIDSMVPVIVMTAWGSVELAVEAMRRGARDFIQKPWDNPRLLSIVRTQIALTEALRKGQRLEAENRLLRADGRPKLIAESPSMQPVLQLIARVGPSDANVLITGEPGTGKEVVAQTIHAISDRSSKPLVTVNAGGLAEGIFESELFGHVKGAFTDAKTDRVGRFELAKLLRVLETGEMERVGSSKTKKVNARILSATNANLQEEVGSGRFREDLLFRLNTIEIPLPPLRKRKEDIPLLASHFLSIYAQRYRKRLSGFDSAAMQALMDNPWQGNVRELNHVVERAVLLAQDNLIRLSDLALRTSREGPARLEDMSLEDVEAFLIKKALARYDGNVSHAASALGLSRSALYRRLQRYNL
jgi:DNA-binding NtrC family response regulator